MSSRSLLPSPLFVAARDCFARTPATTASCARTWRREAVSASRDARRIVRARVWASHCARMESRARLVGRDALSVGLVSASDSGSGGGMERMPPVEL